jgi:hypothetical protein
MFSDDLEVVLAGLPAHHLLAAIPAELRPWLLPIDWDRERLWRLDLAGSRLGLEELRWHFELPWWRNNGAWFQVTPSQFRANPTAYPEHVDRVARADLALPLHVIRRRGRWLILDGIHRLLKADMRGQNTIEAVTLTVVDVARIARYR